jgi:hypothetical protein
MQTQYLGLVHSFALLGTLAEWLHPLMVSHGHIKMGYPSHRPYLELRKHSQYLGMVRSFVLLGLVAELLHLLMVLHGHTERV